MDQLPYRECYHHHLPRSALQASLRSALVQAEVQVRTDLDRSAALAAVTLRLNGSGEQRRPPGRLGGRRPRAVRPLTGPPERSRLTQRQTDEGARQRPSCAWAPASRPATEAAGRPPQRQAKPPAAFQRAGSWGRYCTPLAAGVAPLQLAMAAPCTSCRRSSCQRSTCTGSTSCGWYSPGAPCACRTPGTSVPWASTFSPYTRARDPASRISSESTS